MRKLIPVGVVLLSALTGCGLENLFSGLPHKPFEPPASKIAGAATWQGVGPQQFQVVDGTGKALEPFEILATTSSYEIRLDSSKYSMLRAQARAGHLQLRALVPFLGPESKVSGADFDARNMTETLIVEANLSATGQSLAMLNSSAYDDPVTGEGTRKKIRAAFDAPAATATPGQLATQELLHMVERIIPRGDPLSGDALPGFFYLPVFDASYNVVVTPAVDGHALSADWLVKQNTFGNPVDYTGDGVPDLTTTAFDAQLGQVARLYKPEGCPDPTQVRLVFTVDFNPGCQSGSGGPLNRFLWTTDKPGKTMFFVGWVHKESQVQDPRIGVLLGNSVPNQLQMHDDGTNGDEVASDGIYTIVFDVPIDPTGLKKLRIGYKYTWGFKGQQWTGSEEWPGNSRILQVEDMGPFDPVTGKGDGFVYRRDVYQDEASNKDRSNLNARGNGSLLWDQDLRGCGSPEAREQRVTLVSPTTPVIVSPGNMSLCGGTYYTPPNLSTINAACL